jgi:transcriptional regulator with XRE-family HTH domain
MDPWTDQDRAAFGKRLRDARISKALSQPDVAAMFDATKQSVSSWEKGRNLPTAEDVARLADEFGVSVEWLLFGVQTQALSMDLRKRLVSMDADSLRRIENGLRAQLDMPLLSAAQAESAHGKPPHRVAA